MNMLTIQNLTAKTANKEVLKGIHLGLKAGEVHAIMGPNGSGKSTLAGVLAGRDAFDVTEGQILYNGQDLLELDPEERAREELFRQLGSPGGPFELNARAFAVAVTPA